MDIIIMQQSVESCVFMKFSAHEQIRHFPSVDIFFEDTQSCHTRRRLTVWIRHTGWLQLLVDFWGIENTVRNKSLHHNDTIFFGRYLSKHMHEYLVICWNVWCVAPPAANTHYQNPIEAQANTYTYFRSRKYFGAQF